PGRGPVRHRCSQGHCRRRGRKTSTVVPGVLAAGATTTGPRVLSAYDSRTDEQPVSAVPDGGEPADDSQPLRVVVADDWYLVREGARSALSSIPGIDVV